MADLLALVTPGTGLGGGQVLLRRWDAETGRALPDVTPFATGFAFRYASADGRHLLASKPLDRPGAGGERYIWSIVSVATGEHKAEVRHHLPAARFFVSGSRLVHQSPRSRRRVAAGWVEEPFGLRAIDLETGKEVWTWPVPRHPALWRSAPPAPSESRSGAFVLSPPHGSMPPLLPGDGVDPPMKATCQLPFAPLSFCSCPSAAVSKPAAR